MGEVIDGTGKIQGPGLAPPTTSGQGPIVQVVKVKGDPGDPGENSYTLTSADFTMPVGDGVTTVTVGVEDSKWVVPGQPIFIGVAGAVNVVAVPSNESITIVNPGFSGNADFGTLIGAGAKVSPGGTSGPIGNTVVDGGSIDYTGQPILNSPANGAHLQVEQDQLASCIDATYGDGTQLWHGGVWVFAAHSVMRIPAGGATLPILRIALPPNLHQGAVGRSIWWDKPNNRLYVFTQTSGFDNPSIYVIDTTPRVDPSGQFVGACPGIIGSVSYKSTAIASAGFFSSFLVDPATKHYWFFQNGANTTFKTNFDGSGLTTFTTVKRSIDSLNVNGQLWSASYDTGTNMQYAVRLNQNGTENVALLINTQGSNLLGTMFYDAIHNVLWIGTGGFSNTLVVGVQPTLVGPAVIHSWAAITFDGIAVQADGNLLIGGQQGYSPTGSLVGGGGLFLLASSVQGSLFGTVIVSSSALTPSDVYFQINNSDGFIYSIGSPLTQPPNQPISPYEFVGGIQEWVVGGGTTYPLVHMYAGIPGFDVPEAGTGATIIFGARPLTPTRVESFFGTSAIISAHGGGQLLIDGLALPVYGDGDGLIGYLTIWGAANPENNGTFQVNTNAGTTATTLIIFNPNGAPGDAHNGSIGWSFAPQYRIIFPLSSSFGAKILDFSGITNLQESHSITATLRGNQSVELLPLLKTSPFLFFYWDGVSASPTAVPILTNVPPDILPQGTIDPVQGQPIVNGQADNSTLASFNDSPGQIIDGSYNSTAPWAHGLWVCTEHSIIRVSPVDPARPLLRIPLPEGFVPLTRASGLLGRTMQWDEPNNRLYVFDQNGPKVYTIDTTPTPDPTGKFVAFVPGVINVVDLSGFGPTGFQTGVGVGTYEAFVVDLVDGFFWVVTQLLDTTPSYFFFEIDHNLVTGVTGTKTFLDAIYVPADFGFAGLYYTKSDIGTGNAELFRADITLGTITETPVTILSNGVGDLPDNLFYDSLVGTIWIGSSAHNGTVWGVSVATTAIIQQWDVTPAATVNGQITLADNGDLFVPISNGTIVRFTPAGVSVFTYTYPLTFTSLSRNGYGTVPVSAVNYLFATNAATGFIDEVNAQSNSALTDWHFIGGKQQWTSLAAGSPYGTFPWTSTPAEDSVVPAGDTTIYLDGGNQTYLTEGTTYSGSGPGTGLIAIADGTNRTPSLINSGANFAFANRPYSRSDRIVTQFSRTTGGTGGVIYQGAPGGFSGGAGGTIVMVQLVSVSGFEQPSDGSWLFVLDTASPGTAVALFAYNPSAVTPPSFSVDGAGNVSVLFGDNLHSWTVVVMAASMVVNGGL